MVEHITFQDKTFPFLFSWKAFKEYSKSVGEADGIETLENGYYLGFKHGAKKEGKEVEFSQEQMSDMFDDSPEFQEKVVETWTKHFGVQKKIQEKAIQGLSLN